jgi:hypothetical protein
MSKNLTEICTFSLLLMFIKLVLFYNFFGSFFINCFNGFEISVKFGLYIFSYFINKKKFVVILALFENFGAKRAKNG